MVTEFCRVEGVRLEFRQARISAGRGERRTRSGERENELGGEMGMYVGELSGNAGSRKKDCRRLTKTDAGKKREWENWRGAGNRGFTGKEGWQGGTGDEGRGEG